MGNEFELKLLAMIGSLKNEIDGLREEVHHLRRHVEGKPTEIKRGDERITINEVRDYIKNQLLSVNPILEFTNGTRETGKLTISNGVNTVKRILIRTSKSFREKEGIPSGWITVNEDLLNKYDLYFFVVKDFISELHVFVMNQNDMSDWIKDKQCDSNGNYHFYINYLHGSWIDDREGEYNFGRYYENWSTVSDLLNE
jgi:hypothetical protein